MTGLSVEALLERTQARFRSAAGTPRSRRVALFLLDPSYVTAHRADGRRSVRSSDNRCPILHVP